MENRFPNIPQLGICLATFVAKTEVKIIPDYTLKKESKSYQKNKSIINQKSHILLFRMNCFTLTYLN